MKKDNLYSTSDSKNKIMSPSDSSGSYILPALISFAAVCMYFLCDPTMEWCYPLYCTYRIQTIVRILRVMIRSAVFLLFIYMLVRFRKEGHTFSLGTVLPFLGIYAGYFIACVLNTGKENLAHWLGAFITGLTPLLIVLLMFSCSEKRGSFLYILALFYLCLSVLNLLFYFFPQLYIGEARDWREDFFLGSKNRTGWPLLLGAFFVLLDARERKRYIIVISYLILLIANLLISKAITFALGTLILIFLLLPFIRKAVNRIDTIWFVFSYVVIFLICMFFLEPLLQTKAAESLLNAIGKDSTLSDRTVLWNTAISLVLQHPVFGVGFQETSGFIPHTNPYGTTYHHGHNELLQTWYEGGIVTVFLGFLMLFTVAHYLRKCSDQDLTAIGKAVLFSFMVMLSADLIPYCCWYMLALIGHVLLLLEKPISVEY